VHVTRLDCGSPDNALRSLSAILNVDPIALRGALLEAPVDSDFQSRLLSEPYEAIASLGIERGLLHAGPPQEVVWFHGTRLARGTSFERGLLPLSQCIEQLREVVEHIARDRAIPQGARSSNSSYCLKMMRLDALGPCASLLREAVVRPTRPQRDFLASPEIVEDLAEARAGDRSAEIIAAYRRSTQPCIVAFCSRASRPDVVPLALVYCYSHIHGLENPTQWNTCFDGRGAAVPPEDILQIEWLPG
jgi:hypothetical protein